MGRMIIRKETVAFAIIFSAAVIFLGFYAGQSDFESILIGYGVSFLSLAFLWQSVRESDIPFYLTVGILIRFVLIFALPQLSDDVYRFIWDGRLITHGYNPFHFLPQDIMAEGWAQPWLNQELYEQLNSQDHYTIYPPVAQLVFAIAAWLFPHSIYGSTLVMKVFVFLGEIGVLLVLPKLLKSLQLSPKNVILYALNPLVIIEVVGNLHFEGVMVFFLLLSIHLLFRSRLYWSALAMAFSIATKLLPLLFLMFLIRRIGWRNVTIYFVIVGISLLLMFAPLLDKVFLFGFADSLDLYFQKFEFNASVYYVLRSLGFWFTGYNLIKFVGPGLAALTFLGILWSAIREKEVKMETLPHKMLFAICLYLAFSPTVHPWYAIMPLALSLLTSFRFPVIWSALITLTYINYMYTPYWENLWVVALEYIVVYCWAARELKQGGIFRKDLKVN